MADELVPNPDRCTHFEPNSFKREKCRQCGHGWQMHKGIISDELVAGYVMERRTSIDVREKAEAAAKAKARAKGQAKKKANQSVQDDWLYDGANDSDSDDGVGFQMFSANNLDSAPIESASRRETMAQSNKPLKVVNLIDLSECDLPVEEETAAPASMSCVASSSGASAPLLDASLIARSPSPPCDPPPCAAPRGAGGSPPGSMSSMAQGSNGRAFAQQNEAALLSEIEHLRQMLADTNEEKSIQVAVFRDQLDEKEQLIDDLRRDRAKSEDSLRNATESLEALNAHAAQPVPEQSTNGSSAHDEEHRAAHRDTPVYEERMLRVESTHLLAQELEDAVFARDMDVVERDRLMTEAELSRSSGGLAKSFCRIAVRCLKPDRGLKILS